MKTLLLIDGNSLFHRAYHALPPITDKSGEVANAVFGFSNMLLKAIGEVKPDYVACAFDTKAPTFRHVEFEQYKAQRVEPPADLYPQLPKVKRVLDAFGIAYFEKEGYEADDLIATLTSKCLQTTDYRLQSKKKKAVDSRQLTVVILSGDRDVLQLVDGDVKVQMPSSAKASEGKPGHDGLFDAKAVKEKFGVTPQQIVDYKSLTGDASDNVPGIAGVGPKTAAVLLQKYHTLENLFKNIDKVDEKVRTKLEVGKDIALAAKRLVELDRDVNIEFRVESLEFSPDWTRVRREYEELGFKSIVAKLPEGTKEVSEAAAVSQPKAGRPLDEKESENSDQLELI